jgi:hypothetical protein
MTPGKLNSVHNIHPTRQNQAKSSESSKELPSHLSHSSQAATNCFACGDRVLAHVGIRVACARTQRPYRTSFQSPFISVLLACPVPRLDSRTCTLIYRFFNEMARFRWGSLASMIPIRVISFVLSLANCRINGPTICTYTASYQLSSICLIVPREPVVPDLRSCEPKHKLGLFSCGRGVFASPDADERLIPKRAECCGQQLEET